MKSKTGKRMGRPPKNTVANTPQPPPKLDAPGENVYKALLVLMQQRAEFGLKKYGTYLKTHNGRVSLSDLMQELLDAPMYLLQHMLEERDRFVDTFNVIAEDVNRNAIDKGFWDGHTNSLEENATKIALIHAEASEALEGMRHGNPPSDHIPEFTAVEEELADIIIRIMDFAVMRNHRVAQAILAKHQFNKGRESMHGGKKF